MLTCVRASTAASALHVPLVKFSAHDKKLLLCKAVVVVRVQVLKQKQRAQHYGAAVPASAVKICDARTQAQSYIYRESWRWKREAKQNFMSAKHNQQQSMRAQCQCGMTHMISGYIVRVKSIAIESAKVRRATFAMRSAMEWWGKNDL